MKKISCIIIIFLLFIFLTGCDRKDDDLNKQIKYINQVNRLDKEYFTLYEQLSGIELSKQKILTKTEENIVKEPKEDVNQNIESDNIDKSSTIEISQVQQRDTLLSDTKESNWKNSKELSEQLQDLVIDIQVEMGNNNVEEKIINEYKKEFDNLINNIIREDKKNSIISISNLLYYSEIFVDKCIKNEELLIIKKTYYSSIKSLIFLELNNMELFASELEKLKNNMFKVNEKCNYEEIDYIKKRVNNIISSVSDNYEKEEKENIRLKLVMLIETIPNAESYVQKLTIK